MPYVNLRIRELKTPKERLEFIKFPWRIYKRDPNWVPPLISERKEFFDPEKNPSFKHMDVALFMIEGEYQPDGSPPPPPHLRQGPLGIISAHINHIHNEFHGEKVGFFGFFESVNDREVAHRLLKTASDWVAERGMMAIRGPMNFSTNDECGMLVEGFDSPPVVLMTYNPPYYMDLVESFGFTKVMDLLAYIIDTQKYPSLDALPPKLQRVINIVKRRYPHVRARKMNKKDFRNEVERFKHVYNHAWEKNWGFVPLTDEEIDHMAKNLIQIIDTDLAWFAEVRRDDGTWEPIGASLTLPDYNQVLIHMDGKLFPIGWLKFLWYRRKIDTARIFALGVVHKWHGKGIDALLYYETARELFRKGYKRAEMSWLLETNFHVLNSVRNFGGKLYKRYRIYEKPLP